MIVAVSIFALVLGALLCLASQLGDLDLDLLSLVLILAGALGTALGLLQNALVARRGRRSPRS